MDITQRISQFENMVQADPTNDMAHFSLASAYAQVGRHAEAATSYLRCTEVNAGFTKAYQLAGKALIDAGDSAKASEVLAKGYIEAATRGDRLPQKAMAELLAKLGTPLPELPKAVAAAAAVAEVFPPDAFICAKSGKPGTKMSRPPFRGPIGDWIAANISKETFNEWIAQGTKVINELRLDITRDDHAATYDKYMYEYLGMDDELLNKLQPKS